MKKIINLYFKHYKDHSKNCIFDISDKKIKKIKEMLSDENNNVFFRINNELHKIIVDENEEYSCEDCSIHEKCYKNYNDRFSCITYELKTNNKNEEKSKYFKKVDEYQFLFSND